MSSGRQKTWFFFSFDVRNYPFTFLFNQFKNRRKIPQVLNISGSHHGRHDFIHYNPLYDVFPNMCGELASQNDDVSIAIIAVFVIRYFIIVCHVINSPNPYDVRDCQIGANLSH